MTRHTETFSPARSASAVDRIALVDIAFIVALWCVSSAAVDPSGEFPLNDDWSYALTVRHLLETGDYRPTGWAFMTLITHVLWGAAFCLPDGFSFTALRLSTMVASVLGIAGCYALAHELRQPRWFVVAVTLAFAFNPVYYALSHTYMTDIPFTALAIWSAVFLARSLKSGSDAQLLTGTVLALAATLSRQLALCIPLGFAIALLLSPGITRRTVLRACIPLFACAAAFLAFSYWLAASDRLPAMYASQADVLLLPALANLNVFTMKAFVHTYVALLYLGLFLSPILLFWARDLFQRRMKQVAAIVAGGILAMAPGALLGVSILKEYVRGVILPIPIPGNILVASGLGPLTLRDTFILHLDHMPALPPGLWILVTVLGVLGALLLIACLGLCAVEVVPKLWRRTALGKNQNAGLFLLLSGAIYVLPMLAFGFFDRYFMLCIPLFAVGIAGLRGTRAGPACGMARPLRFAVPALLAAFGLFAIAGTHDYLAWNRTRWTALQDLMHAGQVGPEDIDGGFEFNGLHFYDAKYQAGSQYSWWWVRSDTYLIGFGAVPGYKVMKEFTYVHWLPAHPQTLAVLRKE